MEPALLSAAAAVAALVVAAYLGGDCLPDGVTVEITSPWPRLDHRKWSRHPHCPHHDGALIQSPEMVAGAHGRNLTRQRETMST